MERSDEVIRFFNNSTNYLSNRYGIRLRAEIIKDFTGESSFKTVLDIGCADGSLSLPFIEKADRIVLMDISPVMLVEAKKNIPSRFLNKVEFIEGDFIESELGASRRFDLILGVGLLAHVNSVPATIGKISEHLNEGGLAIIQITDHERIFSKLNLLFRKSKNPYRVNATTYRDLVGLLHAHSLRVIYKERYALVLPGFGKLGNKLLYRWNRLTRTNSFLNRMTTDVIVGAKRETNFKP